MADKKNPPRQAVTSLYDAKTHLSDLVDRAAAGEEIVIAKNGAPKARLVPLARKPILRQPGGWEGKVWISPNFDDPLPDDIMAAINGEADEPPS